MMELGIYEPDLRDMEEISSDEVRILFPDAMDPVGRLIQVFALPPGRMKYFVDNAGDLWIQVADRNIYKWLPDIKDWGITYPYRWMQPHPMDQ